MKLFWIPFLVLGTLFATAQTNVDLTSPLPEDPAVSKGTLDNGMTYYVRANSEPENRAELMLVLKAGSVDEDDDQQGLAHFCEHMAFNGTKNFPKHELINYFESIGMEFGPEINAYTSFDETVYMLKVPLDQPEYMEKGLQVLYDWACQIDDSDEEVNAERGIILEEERMGRGASDRMMKEWLPVFLKDSKYADRLPIGKVDIIENCAPETLRRFRHDWYRPDLQAVIVVGDFDQNEMVAKVKEKFSAIPASTNPRDKKYFGIPGHKETLVSISTDKEARYPIAYVYYKHDLEKSKTLGDYRHSMLVSLYTSMINNRLAEKTQQADPPFLMGQSAYSHQFGPLNTYMSVAVTQGDKIETGLKEVLLENERVKKFGFTETELERQKTAVLNNMEKAYNERNNTKSINYANEYMRNFLITEEPFPGMENEYAYYKELIPGISVEEVNELAKEWITKDNRVVIVTAPENEKTIVPTEEQVKSLLDEVESIEVEPYVDAVANVPLIADEPIGSKVTGEQALEKVDAVEWKLANGATVVVKKTDFKDDEILFNAWSLGGTSVYPKEDDVSANLATDVMTESGIARFDEITLNKMLSDKVFGLNPYISDLREGFNGSSSVKDVETLLQMLYLYFTEPRFDDVSYQSLMKQYATVLENKSASPEANFRDTLNVVLSNYNERSKPMSVERLKEASLPQIEMIGKDRFKDAADFKFFFVGNIDFATLKPLVEKYIGGIPTLNRNEKWVDLGIRKPEGVVEKVVHKGQEEKGMQYIVFHGDFEYNGQNQAQLDAVGKILSTRLLEVIREDKSGVYSIGAYPSSSKFPEPEYTMAISYGMSPDKKQELETAVFDIIKEYTENGPTEEELNKAKEKMLREREIQLRENRFWMNILSNTYYLKNGDFSEYGTFEQLVQNLTVDSTKKAFADYFNFKNYVSVALAPAE
ncbi:insulinase family protein [Maribellus sp. YY47]|uniref:M16 family metallopeptidase n=1 Tax=Maribellus sp. YY47 TaxID=2929486 RepID=UPI002001361C|nr:insulinase family protein [Maribellus sp. YY47]MCK3685440.1 insulinase family protein [Maribellus sp. YY47]